MTITEPAAVAVEYFKATGAELRERATSGDTAASDELTRRKERRAAKQANPASVDTPPEPAKPKAATTASKAAVASLTKPKTKTAHDQLHDQAHTAGTLAALELEDSGQAGVVSIIVKPGSSPFARWAKTAIPSSRKAYHGGWEIPVDGVGADYQRMIAYAQAYVDTLNAAAVSAYVSARDDSPDAA